MEAIKLKEYRHPDKSYQKKFDALIGIDEHKSNLLFALRSILDEKNLHGWLKKYHPKGLPYIENSVLKDSLVILSGDVGCGKTEIAHSIATPLSKLMGGETIVVFETPSNIRGAGFVGQLPSRITEAFDVAKKSLKKGEFGILLIDEADDIATSRDQMQAHHEDRTGVNALIKEIDQLQREDVKLATVLITNRPNALDPAVVRRASLHLKFERPTEEILASVIERVFEGVKLENGTVKELVDLCLSKKLRYSYSDITKRIAKQSLALAWRREVALSKEIISEVIKQTEPSPYITENNKI